MKLKPDDYAAIAAILFVAALLIGAPIWGWYRAGVQRDVYARQGVEMTQWEVFIGTKVVERTVNIK